MASCDFLKATHSKASSGGMRVHLENESRELHGHSNTDIDTTKTERNYAIGCETYSKALEHLKERTRAVDAIIPPMRVKKDRVTAVFLEIPCPNEIVDRDKFFQKAYDFACERLGKDNVHGGFVHKDEVHEYTDKNGHIRTSLEHMHVLASPYTAEKGINGKAFLTKPFLIEWNKAFCQMVAKEFGVQYNTHEAPGKKTVEEMKLENKEHELVRLAKIEAEQTRKISKSEEKLQDLTDEIDKQKARVKYGKKTVKMSREEALEGYMNSKDYKQKLGEVTKKEFELNHREKALELGERTLEREREDFEHIRDDFRTEYARFELSKGDFDKVVLEKAETLKNGKMERLETFCESVKLENGKSVLDLFKEQERERRSQTFSR